MKHNTKTIVLSAVAVIIIGVVITGCLSLFRQPRPNVLLIVLDTARADHLSCYGYSRKTSPYIDTLGAEGIVYEFAYAPACWTLPSHASLFTGLEPLEAGATSETLHLPESNKTIAEMLSKAGYDTAAFVCNTWVSKERGFGQGFHEYYEMWRSTQTQGKVVHVSDVEAVTTEKVVTWLKEHTVKKDPFFLFINLNCVHLPYQPPEPHLSAFLSSDYADAESERISSIMSMWKHLAGELQLTERDYSIMRDLYDGEIAFADQCVKQITETLRSIKMLDNTIVIVTSDHGENLGEHDRIDHALSMYETTLHVPLIIRYPKRFEAGTRSKELISLVDIAPTLIDLCDVTSEQNNIINNQRSLAGNDFVNRPFVGAANERPMMGISIMKKNFPDFDTSIIDHRLGAIRTKNHKLLNNIGGTVELYDMIADPHEINDLSHTKVDIRNKLHHILNSWRNGLISGGQDQILQSQDEESLEILRSLGYVE